jgi:hypothetical protein
MNTDITSCLVKFKESIIQFLDALIEQFPEQGDIVIFRIFLQNQIDINFLIQQFTKFVLPHKDEIKTRNEKFFLENDNIFGSAVGKNKILHFKKIWSSDRLDKDDREQIWRWFDLFIRHSEKYLEMNKKFD